MKFTIEQYTGSRTFSKIDLYYISIDSEEYYDINVAVLLGFSLKEYLEILFSYGAIMSEDFNEAAFKNREDVERAVEYLIPLLIMANLLS
jgi:hypothetical protein